MSHVTAAFLQEQGLSPTFPARFFAKVHITESCWIWTGALTIHGYGYINRGRRGLGCIHAHQASWMLHFGPIPHGFWVLHDCPGGDIPRCCNPAHLWLGTAKENTRDMISKGRQAYGEERNHKLSEQDVLEILANYPHKSQNELASVFGVTRSTIRDIVRNKHWVHLRREVISESATRQGRGGKLTEEQVLDIRKQYPRLSQLQLAAMYHVCKGTISAIITRTNWRHI